MDCLIPARAIGSCEAAAFFGGFPFFRASKNVCLFGRLSSRFSVLRCHSSKAICSSDLRCGTRYTISPCFAQCLPCFDASAVIGFVDDAEGSGIYDKRLHIMRKGSSGKKVFDGCKFIIAAPESPSRNDLASPKTYALDDLARSISQNTDYFSRHCTKVKIRPSRLGPLLVVAHKGRSIVLGVRRE